MPIAQRDWPQLSGACSPHVRAKLERLRPLAIPPPHLLALRRLLAEKEDECGRISALLAADGSVGSQVAGRLAAVRRREQELRGLEDKRTSLEERMRAFSGMSAVPPACVRVGQSAGKRLAPCRQHCVPNVCR